MGRGSIATDAKGNFSVNETNSDGVNTFNFLIIDPYGQQVIRSYPEFWIPFAASDRKSLRFHRPCQPTTGGRVISDFGTEFAAVSKQSFSGILEEMPTTGGSHPWAR